MCLHGHLENLQFWTETENVGFFALDNWLTLVSIFHPLDLQTNQTFQWTLQDGEKEVGRKMRWHQTTDRNLQLLNRRLDVVTLQDWPQTMHRDMQLIN